MAKKLDVEPEHPGWYEFSEHVYFGRRGFPFFGFLLLAIGVLWLLQILKIITVEIPWWPVILIMLGLWIIIKSIFR